MENAVIMVVEDNDEIRGGVRILLENESYTVVEARDGYLALERFSPDIDLVILDVMMPGISGFRTCQEIRKTSNVPILFLTAKTQDADKTTGLMAGGDDYLSKPFSYTELLARVRALLRRYREYRGKGENVQEEKFLDAKGLHVCVSRNEVEKDGVRLDLTEIEYKILLLLMQHPNHVFSTQVIYEKVWEEPFFYVSNGTVMVHIRKLRLKIEDNPQEPKRIRTIWGKGYRFE